MKKRIISILLCVVMLIGLLPTVAFAEGESVTGSGTESDPYVVYSYYNVRILQ